MRNTWSWLVLAFGLLTLWLFQGVSGGAQKQDGETNCYVTGDVNGDCVLDISDPVYLLQHLFLGGLPRRPALTRLPAVSRSTRSSPSGR